MQKISADVAIIGGGIAGLSAALGLSQRKVVVVTKAEFGKGGSTPIAQGASHSLATANMRRRLERAVLHRERAIVDHFLFRRRGNRAESQEDHA